MLDRLLSLFLKPNCSLCQRQADDVFCEYCQDKLSNCKLSQQHQKLINSDFLLFSWGKYDRDLKRAIAFLKYNQKGEIGQLFGIWLGTAWLRSGNKKKYPHLTVIPIPCHAQRVKSRGYNQAELIARGFCQVTNYPLKVNLLLRKKDTEAMFGLNPRQRQENISEAFQIGKDYLKIKPSQPILIIDDIYTTGTTVKEAKRVLNQAKLSTIGVATVSRVN